MSRKKPRPVGRPRSKKPLRDTGPRYVAENVKVGGWKLPNNKPRVLIAQLLTRYLPAAGPLRTVRVAFDDDYKRRLFSAVDEARRHNAQFLVFPEYAWPLALLAEGIGLLADSLPEMACCILPLEHLSMGELREAIEILKVSPEQARTVVADIEGSVAQADLATAVVNVCALVFKVSGGLKVYLQPKIRPAGLEDRGYLGVQLAGGRKRYVFEGSDIRIATTICFDIVARDEAVDERPRDAVASARLDILFVPECNPKPLHEMYARTVVDLFEEPKWAREQSVVVFANVAGGSVLPGLSESYFGFSRCVGRLGATSKAMPDVFMTAKGQVAHDAPTSLSVVESGAQFIENKLVTWAIARQQESLVSFTLPTLRTGPSRDPSTGRTDTEVSVSRWAGGNPGRWHPIRVAFDLGIPIAHVLAAPSRPIDALLAVPQEHLVQPSLVGTESVEAEFLVQLGSAPTPVWVFGEGGIGKTAVVANALHRAVECTGLARVVWVDMARLQASAEDLLDTLLQLLGMTSGLGRAAPEKWQLLDSALRSSPTIVVLDSFEKWRLGASCLPEELKRLHGWPTRVVVTSRLEPDENEGRSVLVPPLSTEAGRKILQRMAGASAIPNQEAVEKELGGKPLAFVWFAGLMIAAPDQAAAFANSLQGGSKAQDVFDWCAEQLSPAEQNVLSVLSELPAPIAATDLGTIVGAKPGEVSSAVRRLRRLNLVEGSDDGTEIHARHPFVQQFWRARERNSVQEQVLAWADRILEAFGGDRNWAGHPELERCWPNLRHVISELLERDEDSSKGHFLSMWRRVDYFLWSSGRLRERLDYGRAAALIARKLNATKDLAHALYDSIAETLWHRDGDSGECDELLDEARVLFESLGDLGGEAMVAYYRGRLARKRGSLQLAQCHAVQAVRLASRAGDARIRGMTMNGLGNVYRDRNLMALALRRYGIAGELLAAAEDSELVAVVDRNLGRCAYEVSDFGTALTRLERAMEEFRKLALPVEEAEAAMYRALTLLRLGDREEALGQLDLVRAYFARVGAASRVRELDDARRAEKPSLV